MSLQHAAGYHIDENSLVAQAFDVKVQCAENFHGTPKATQLQPTNIQARDTYPVDVLSTCAKVAPCTTDGSEYSVSGCEENFCNAPSTIGGRDSCAKPGSKRKSLICVSALPGYDVSELDLRQKDFEVHAVASCVKLCMKPQLQVQAACAMGYEGTAVVEKCTVNMGHWA